MVLLYYLGNYENSSSKKYMNICGYKQKNVFWPYRILSIPELIGSSKFRNA